MPNKFLKEYVESKNNKQSNYEQILSKVEGVSKMNVMKTNFLKIATVAAMFLIIIVGIPKVYAKIQWNIEFKEFKNREYITGTAEIKDDYTEKIEMDYIEQNGIKVKIDSLNITDDHFEAMVDFEFDQGIEVNSQSFITGFAVYDEEKNIYGISSNLKSGEKVDKTPLYLYEELGIKYNKKDIYAVQLMNANTGGAIEANGRNIKVKISMDSVKGFPKSKKIFIRIFDLGYFMANPESRTFEKISISDSEWRFEINVPEKFYERNTMNLKIEEDIPGVQISKLDLSENGLIVKGIFEGSNKLISSGKDMKSDEWIKIQENLLYITDSRNNRFKQISLGTDMEKDSLNIKFDVRKNNFLESDLFINYTDSNGNIHTRKLVENN